MNKRKILVPLIILISVFVVSISLTGMLLFRNVAFENALKKNDYEFSNGKYTYETSELVDGITTKYSYEYDTAVKRFRVTQNRYLVEEGVAVLVMRVYYVHVQTGDFTAYYTVSTIPNTDTQTDLNAKGNIYKMLDKYSDHAYFNDFIFQSTDKYFDLLDDSWIPTFIYRL
ncbi:hypothetical protein [Acholeplasma hippikon]|uniref:Uncharacterized protein n=1 Tax=Acholeplasma hippikon TaxID=264636 RepID=A0A449BJU4_9MOLU|nr:hypothetical protein [Acholeplasma hippikon]VEU82741.1 Uncharacterised protein [Acholeplasma hippikon]